jgi:uncharacterized membrane protein YkvA (DUF1232 family)
MKVNKEQDLDFLGKIMASIFFKKSLGKASSLSNNTTGLLQLLKKTLTKTQELGMSGVVNEIKDKIYILSKITKSYASGEYKEIQLKSLIIIVASLIYFLSPIDFVPDFIPILGLTDDLALLSYVLKTIADEIERFEIWELNKKLNN